MIKVEYIESMGNDWSAVEAARVSYQKGTKRVSDDRRLLSYLMRHRHDGVFEMAQLKVRVRCPLYISHQIMRHRTFSYNQISARYSIMTNEAYQPTKFAPQSPLNKQGRYGEFEPHIEMLVQSLYRETCEDAFKNYQILIDLGVSRELARGILPTATMTEFIMNGDLRAWLHFIDLRIKSNAQEEIQEVARQVLAILEEHFPETVALFKDRLLAKP